MFSLFAMERKITCDETAQKITCGELRKHQSTDPAG